MVRVHNSSINDECYRGDAGSNPVSPAKGANPETLKEKVGDTSERREPKYGGMVYAMDGYSTMCKKAYSVCGHYNGNTITGSNPVTWANF